jgi:autotransporter strand-loop-strand O-heptosyltransferase
MLESDMTTDSAIIQEQSVTSGSLMVVEPKSAGARWLYPAHAETLTQEGVAGIRFDFNHGAQIVLPQRDEGRWRVTLSDHDTRNIIFSSENSGALIRSSKKWFVRFEITIAAIDEHGVSELVFEHTYDARNKEVLIHFPVGTLGDTLAWFPYAARFAQVHGCRLTCSMSPLIIPLLKDAYPDICFVTPEEAVSEKLAEKAYATYCLGLFFNDADNIFQPTDFRHVGLHRTAAYILGVDPAEEAPRLSLPDESRPIDEPYVCIGAQSSSQAKYWNNPTGWRGIVDYLRSTGYRVICIDQKPVHGQGFIWNHIPYGSEDQTGDRPLVERARWLRHAAAFIGLSSGLAWLAWAAGSAVIMISGFTHPTNEFHTPYRVINWHACNSCWNDIRHTFDHADFLWCPRHKGSERQFECTRLITLDQVIGVLKRVTSLPDLSPAV